MGLFSQARDLYKLQKQAKQIKEELKKLHIEAEMKGVLVTVSAEQEIIDIKISPELLEADKATDLQKILVEAINKAMKKAQEIAAERMKGMLGDMGMNLPGTGA